MTVAGREWRIRGSGPVNFTGADDFEFDSGTAGITPTDHGRPDTVTLSEFAVSSVTKFEDQTINVLGDGLMDRPSAGASPLARLDTFR